MVANSTTKHNYAYKRKNGEFTLKISRMSYNTRTKQTITELLIPFRNKTKSIPIFIRIAVLFRIAISLVHTISFFFAIASWNMQADETRRQSFNHFRKLQRVSE